MNVTAAHLREWARTREAQGLLPTLVRKLISATTSTTALAIPGGDSVNTPGWDGVVNADKANAWVPVGLSVWEMGCNEKMGGKANADFSKREPLEGASYLFVTPRRWQKKNIWAQQAQQASTWRAVRAYDADDLEAWLDAAPAVQLWFAQELGLAGPGVETVAAAWERWRTQSVLPITPEAIKVGRAFAAQAFEAAVHRGDGVIAVIADAREEAAAWSCLQLAASDLADHAVCVTSVQGWRYVEANPELKVGVALTAAVAAARQITDGFTMIVPTSIGDGIGLEDGDEGAQDTRVRLERADLQPFAEALVTLGEEPSDSARLARTVGRSWSVYRRVRSRIPAVRRPPWLQDSASLACLTSLTLVSAWNDSRAGDRAFMAAISGRPYEEMERELRRLAVLDDAPVMQIGRVWRAKAPLELLHQVAPHISRSEFDRFLATAKAVLTTPDPSLELPEDRRWMASVYGKVREESGIVIDAIVSSLAKLSVYAERTADPLGTSFASGIDTLVRDLLWNAEGARWLSLSGVLRELAEAAPNIFLDALEHSLDAPGAPVRTLLTETTGSGFGGRCWHADLLWSLELLAWAPNRLARCSRILARLSSTPVQGNWGNTPMGSLNSIFRLWWPQTAANEQQRMRVLDRLLQNEPEPAWSLLVRLVSPLNRHGSYNAHPIWREDDAGALEPERSPEKVASYCDQVRTRLLQHAITTPARVADLVASIGFLRDEDLPAVCAALDMVVDADDADKVKVRDRLREYLHWQNSFNTDGSSGSRVFADGLALYFDRLAPQDPVLSHVWILKSGWVDLPEGQTEDYEKTDAERSRRRADGVAQIHAYGGLDALHRAIQLGADGFLVGYEIAKSGLGRSHIDEWLLTLHEATGLTFHDPLIAGVLQTSQPDERLRIMRAATARLDPARSEPKALASFASSAPMTPETWEFVNSLPPAVRTAYWTGIRPGMIRVEGDAYKPFLDQLLAHGRPRTAFRALGLSPKDLPPEVLFDLLETLAKEDEPEGPMPEGWRLTKALAALTESGQFPRRRLAMLEWVFHHAFRFGQGAPANLRGEMMSDAAFFMEIVCLAYKAHSGPRVQLDEHQTSLAAIAFGVLHDGSGAPGADQDGTVDRAELDRWIKEARSIAAEQDRVAVTDQTIGRWLAGFRIGKPDWPAAAILDLLDRQDGNELRSGFKIGVVSSRGVTTRAFAEGGKQERDIAAGFCAKAQTLQESHPLVAAMFEQLAAQYEHDARREDEDARLDKEGP